MNIIDKLFNKIGYMLITGKYSVPVILGLFLISKNHLYININYIKPLRLWRLLKKSKNISITSTGVLIVFYKYKVVKYPLGEHSYNALNREYTNYLLLKKSRYSNFVDYLLKRKDKYYIADRLFDVIYPVLEHKNICLQLSNIKNDDLICAELIKSKVYDQALKYIKEQCGIFCIDSIVNILKSKKSIKSCPMHGDLTQYNIMKNKNGNVVLIDLNRFTFNDGIEKLDRIHFAVEYFARKKKQDFFAIVRSTIQNRNISVYYFNLLLLYVIYRVGVEYDKNIKLPLSYRKEMCKTVEIFLAGYNEVR